MLYQLAAEQAETLHQVRCDAVLAIFQRDWLTVCVNDAAVNPGATTGKLQRTLSSKVSVSRSRVLYTDADAGRRTEEA